MEFRSIRHRGLRRFIEDNDARELQQTLVARIRRITTAIHLANDTGSILGPPGWRIHQLSGDRADVWSISVSGNWRITFEVQDNAVQNLDLEDYH